MASLISGYSYDIFVSYRQKDNKYDGWVTEFVGNLRKELEATFKDEVNIFFDASPTDGLQETHDVDDSLREKLKCLVFIPIISQTYCDPNSFAWKSELLEFKSQASNDAIGLKVKVSGGNVASRILPVVIHELDQEDRSLLEAELGPIRSIDFVLQSSGVNRPLRAKDDDLRPDGSRQPLYRDQVNKVANAVKGIINGIKQPGKETSKGVETRAKRRMPILRIILPIVAVLLLLVAGYAYLEARYRKPISIAVLPFKDMSPNHDKELFSDGLSEELINVLTRVATLEVKARTSSFAFKGKEETVQSMAEKLGATHFLQGSVLQIGNRIRVSAQLIRASDESNLWSETFDREGGDVFQIHDEIANAVVQKLSSTFFSEAPEIHSRPVDPQAINFYLQGKYNTMHHKPELGLKYFHQALLIDSLYTKAYAGISWAYHIMPPTDSLPLTETRRRQKEFAMKAYQLNPNEPDAIRSMIQYYMNELNYRGMRELADLVVREGYNDPELLLFASVPFIAEGNVEEALRLQKRACEADPLNYLHQTYLADLYVMKGDLPKAESHAQTSIELSRDIPWSKSCMFLVYFAKKEYTKAIECQLDTSVTNHFPWMRIMAFFPLYALGRKTEAEQLLDTMRHDFPSIIGTCHAVAERPDSAFYYYERAIDEKDLNMLFLKSDILVPKSVKEDIRFNGLLRRMGVPSD